MFKKIIGSIIVGVLVAGIMIGIGQIQREMQYRENISNLNRVIHEAVEAKRARDEEFNKKYNMVPVDSVEWKIAFSEAIDLAN